MKKLFIAVLAVLLLALLPAASLARVYVAGVEMDEGQYLPSGSKSQVKETPESGGYALLTRENGRAVLTLHDYDNNDYTSASLNSYYCALGADESLILRLEGSSTLTNTRKNSLGKLYGDGIQITYGDLTVEGDGSLEIGAADGIYAWSSSSVTINSGTISLTTQDNGIYAGNNVAVNGGTVSINSQGNGITARNDAAISGGTVDVEADGKGILVTNDMAINGVSVTVDAYYGIYSDSGNVDISEGTVSIDASYCGIFSANDVSINGGAVDIEARHHGIYSESDAAISGGTTKIVSERYGIHADETAILSGGELEVTAIEPVRASGEIICSLPLPQGVEIYQSGAYQIMADRALREAGVKQTVRLPAHVSAPVPALPATGDNAHPVMWLTLALLSTLCSVSLVRSKRRWQQK